MTTSLPLFMLGPLPNEHLIKLSDVLFWPQRLIKGNRVGNRRRLDASRLEERGPVVRGLVVI